MDAIIDLTVWDGSSSNRAKGASTLGESAADRDGDRVSGLGFSTLIVQPGTYSSTSISISIYLSIYIYIYMY